MTIRRTLAIDPSRGLCCCRASVDPRTINRDALAVLLGLSTLPRHATATVLDVRRPDELALYGAIPGTSHVPAAELPAALAMAPEEWFRRYRFPKPVAGEPLVMQCRTNR